MLIRNSESVGIVTNAVRNIDVDVDFDVPRNVSTAIDSFNKAVDGRLKSWISENPKPLFTVLCPVKELRREERDILESTLFSYAQWNVIAGDRNNVLFGISKDYTKEQRNKFLMDYMIYNGRFCHRCRTFTEYKANKSIWVCPECGDRVGCHEGTDIAFGSVANPVTAKLRVKLHAKIDSIWRGGVLTRTEVYEQMSSLLGVHKCYTHVAMLGYNQCMLVKKWATAVNKYGVEKCQEEE